MRLVKGAGSPTTGACWMAALNYYTAEDATANWHDHPECVSPVIRTLAIRLNDWCDDGEREALIGPHLFDPVGTAGDLDLERRRAFRCADVACRVWAPRVFDACGLHVEATQLRAMDPVVDRESAKRAYDAASDAADAAYDAAYDAADAAYDAAAAAYDAAYDAAAYDAAAAAYDAAAGATKRELLDLILELCTMGERREVVPCRTQEQVIAEVCR